MTNAVTVAVYSSRLLFIIVQNVISISTNHVLSYP
ncbi:hypothetical protein QQP08_004399 [Theobroma cacao]|nr:hypothetical protein QQP08_004399 [Theobroma cacao]